MKGYSWRMASDVQLCMIAFHDPGAPLKDVLAAREEWYRRNRKRGYSIVQYKEKAVYPR